MNKYNINESVVIYPNANGWEKIREIMVELYPFKNEDEFEAFFRTHIVETGSGYKDQLWSIMQDLGEIFTVGSDYLATTDIAFVESVLQKIPEHTSGEHYMPLPDYLTIKKSKINGLGLFATKKIPAKTDMGLSHIDYKGQPYDLFRSPLGGFYNHSEEPNTIRVKKDGYYILVTLRDIKRGEEILVNYSAYNPEV